MRGDFAAFRAGAPRTIALAAHLFVNAASLLLGWLASSAYGQDTVHPPVVVTHVAEHVIIRTPTAQQQQTAQPTRKPRKIWISMGFGF